MKSVNQAVMKKDALPLITGKPVYTGDLAPKDCLIVKALRSPHARAIVRSVNKTAALKVPGIECILTAEDAPKKRFTIASSPLEMTHLLPISLPNFLNLVDAHPYFDILCGIWRY